MSGWNVKSVATAERRQNLRALIWPTRREESTVVIRLGRVAYWTGAALSIALLIGAIIGCAVGVVSLAGLAAKPKLTDPGIFLEQPEASYATNPETGEVMKDDGTGWKTVSCDNLDFGQALQNDDLESLRPEAEYLVAEDQRLEEQYGEFLPAADRERMKALATEVRAKACAAMDRSSDEAARLAKQSAHDLAAERFRMRQSEWSKATSDLVGAALTFAAFVAVYMSGRGIRYILSGE